MVTVNPYGNCEQCGTPLEAMEVSDASIGRRLCTKCKASEYSTLMGAYSTTCRICGKPLGVEAFTSVGPQICNSCLVTTQLQPFTGQLSIKDFSIPSTATNIGTTLGGLEKGIFDIGKVSIVDPRDEQIAKLEARIKELELSVQDGKDKEEVKTLKKRLDALEKEVPTPSDQTVANPSFGNVCQVLEYWIPRRVRRSEEAYKAELAEYLSGRFLKVNEEARGQLVDILVADKYPIHLKMNPSKNAYNTLVGQVARTVKEFWCVACIIVATPSSEGYNEFVETVNTSIQNGQVRFFPKAK